MLEFEGVNATHSFRFGTEFRGPGTVRLGPTTFEVGVVDGLRLPARFEVAPDSTITSVVTDGHLSAPRFVWYGGTLKGAAATKLTVEVRAGDLFEIVGEGETSENDAAERIIDGAELLVEGGVTWSSPMTVQMANNALWRTDGGTVEIAASGGGVVRNPNLPEGVNDSRIEVVNGGQWSSELSVQLNCHPVDVPFENDGGIILLHGYYFKAGYTNNSGRSVLDGLAKVKGDLVMCDGTLELTLGTLNVEGNVNLGAATLTVPVSQDGYGLLSATGTVSLSGTLAIGTTFNPPVGSRFTILTAGNGVQGQFDSVAGTDLPNGSDYLTLDFDDPTKLDLVVLPE